MNVKNDEGAVTATTTKQEIPVNGKQNVSKMEKTIEFNEVTTEKLNPTNPKISNNLTEEAANGGKVSKLVFVNICICRLQVIYSG